jgi:hypothetical protein
MRFLQTLTILISLIFLVDCADPPSNMPLVFQGNPPLMASPVPPSVTPSPVPTQTPSRTPIPTGTDTFTPTERPQTLLFYGDSVLKLGEGTSSGQVGFSIVDVLRPSINPADQIITSNHGGRKARWGYENLEKNVLEYNPDIVTLWWGVNDLNGCPGIFNRNTNQILKYKLDAYLNLHRMYLKLQIDALLAKNIPVMVVTPVPVLGKLPWSHIGPDNALIWELNYRCDFDIGLSQLAEAQRKMVQDYEAVHKPVYLVDAWQIYKDHPNTDNMYMDILHPGGYGAKLIAERWLQVYQSIQK